MAFTLSQPPAPALNTSPSASPAWISHLPSWTPVHNLPPWTYTYLLPLLGYLVLIRLLRFRHRDNLPRKYGYAPSLTSPISPTQKPLSAMTLTDATLIMRDLPTKEFPTVFPFAIFFALFKTYGIPSISRLLLATGQLSSDAHAAKRASDTSMILTESFLNPPDSDRAVDGIARMNFLHERYRRAGKILDDDMLYTLSLFALEPERWGRRFEWRSVSEIERCATGVFFRNFGAAMEISFDKLAQFMTADGGKDSGGERPGWGRDGLEWLDAMAEWSEAYEREHMVYSESNKELARLTLDIALYNLPLCMHGLGMGMISTALEPRLRKAMMIPPPTSFQSGFFHTLMFIRKYTILYLLPPRPKFLRIQINSEDVDPKTGKFHAMGYLSHPYYVEPTLWSRWGLKALLTRLYGGLLPGDKGDFYRPEGYRISELGPVGMEGKGGKEMAEMRKKLRTMRERGGKCPMALV